MVRVKEIKCRCMNESIFYLFNYVQNEFPLGGVMDYINMCSSVKKNNKKLASRARYACCPSFILFFSLHFFNFCFFFFRFSCIYITAFQNKTKKSIGIIIIKTLYKIKLMRLYSILWFARLAHLPWSRRAILQGSESDG